MTIIILIFIALFLVWYFYKPDINLDNNATTDPYCAVLDEMKKAAKYGNPSSVYATEAKAVIEKLKKLILETLGKPNHRVIITSGASESNNMIIKGFHGKVYVSSMEHKTSLLAAAAKNAMIVPAFNFVNILKNRNMDNSLVSRMAINNETGDYIEDEILNFFEDRNFISHIDMAQFYGKMDKNNAKHRRIVNCADCISISFHKMHGPAGIGALVIPKNLVIDPLIEGSQNDHLRGGTENIMGCAGAIKAIELCLADRTKKNIRLVCLHDSIFKVLQDYPIIFLTKNSINTLLVSFVPEWKFCNSKFRLGMAAKGVKVSVGSACNSGNLKASHILDELGVNDKVKAGTIRFSVGDFNKDSDIDYLKKILPDVFLQSKL